MEIEIEKKFMLNEIPNALIEEGVLNVLSKVIIEQSYLAIDEEQEVRVRKIEPCQPEGKKTYTHTIKTGNGLQRKEVEVEITSSIYEQLLAKSRIIPLKKERIRAKWNDLVVEIDRYDQVDLIVVEVEFQSLDEAEQFTPPSWFGEEIPPGAEYSNKKIWLELQKS